MDWIEVLQRVQQGEDDHTELGRFRAFSEKDWQDAVCAFANTEGGLVVLGVAKDGAIDGVPMDPEEVQERLTNALQTALSAPLQARLGRYRDPKGWVHWIEVARMRGPEPVRSRGKVLVRRGRSSVEPGATELQELYNRVVVTSPGALPKHKRPESVLAGGTPRSRNEAMANYLFDLGLMEQRGSGYPRITRAMAAFNGTAPQLENERTERWVRVTLWRIPP